MRGTLEPVSFTRITVRGDHEATIIQVQAWMGHADIRTTMKYMHHRSRAGDAKLLSAAFRPKKKRKSATERTDRPSTNAVPA